MKDHEFLAYMGDPDLHDAQVERVERRGPNLGIAVSCANGRRLVVEFAGVRDVVSVRGESPFLYALAEASCEPPARRFVFLNWDDDDDARLEVIAESMSVREISP